MVLARIDGAPEGSRGISLFLVPKFNFDDDGSLTGRNGVVTGSIEHKMGIKGSATCVLNFDSAKGYLLGQENRGLPAMFKMMNLERITVGIQGLGFAEVAYQNALAYAQERSQSKAPPPRPDDSKASDPIIYQPDIRRKLLTMRSQIEGCRALAVLTGTQADISESAADDEARTAAGELVALLTPVVKSFFSDLGLESAIEGQQVYGGHGYIREHGMEQLVRDSRIAQIYEGTNEVQAADLVMRKLPMKDGAVVNRFFDELEARLPEDNTGTAAKAALDQLRETTDWISEKAGSDRAIAAGAATLYQRMFGLCVIGCLWADIAGAITGKEGRFYATKRQMARFYMENVLPEAHSLSTVIVDGAESLSDFDGEGFES